MFLTLFAVHRLVDDYELVDVSVSLLCCTAPLCVSPPPLLVLGTEMVRFHALFCEELFQIGIVTMEPFLLLVVVKQSVTRCTDTRLDCRCVRCDFRLSSIEHRLVVPNDSCNAFCWNVSELNNSMTECLIEL